METNKYSMLIGGDFCIPNNIDTLNYSDFTSLWNICKESSFTIFNLECPIINNVKLTTKISKQGPSLYSNPLVLKLIKEGGVNGVSLANNHIMDYGFEGLEQTLNELMNNGINCVGAGLSRSEIRKPLIKLIEGRKVTLLNFAENEFSTVDSNCGANPIDSIDNYYDISKYRKDSDLLFAIVHSGHEGYRLPSPWMKKQFQFYINAGVDAVFVHHSHCYSGYEIFNGKPIFYGLGNLSFYWESMANDFKWTNGYLVGLKFGELKSDFEFELIPYCQGKKGNIGTYLYEENSKEYNAFLEDLKSLNTIIADNGKLNAAYDEYIKQNLSYKMSLLSPYDNRYMRFLARKKILPRFLSKNKKTLLLNLFRCEAHRNSFIDILKSDLKYGK